jgi:pilus assembly protein FimV
VESAVLPDTGSTVESPTLKQARPSSAGVMSEFDADYTTEIDLDDLGLDLDGLDVDLSDEDLEITGVGEFALNTGAGTADHDDEASTRKQALLDSLEDDDVMARTGITQVLGPEELAYQESIADDDATRLAPALMMPGAAQRGSLPGDATARVNILQDFGDDEIDNGPTTRLVSLPSGDLDLDLNLDGPEEQGAGDTVEQPRPRKDALDDIFFGDAFGGDGDEDVLDLDIGELMGDDDDPTGTASVSEPETMTEIGTKLDLARAYIDMGDPDGARSILGEVLEEGDRAQQQEANKLLETLGD